MWKKISLFYSVTTTGNMATAYLRQSFATVSAHLELRTNCYIQRPYSLLGSQYCNMLTLNASSFSIPVTINCDIG